MGTGADRNYGWKYITVQFIADLYTYHGVIIAIKLN